MALCLPEDEKQKSAMHAMRWASKVQQTVAYEQTCDVMEVCCRYNSGIADCVRLRGGNAIRIGVFKVDANDAKQSGNFRVDMSTRSGLKQALELVNMHGIRYHMCYGYAFFWGAITMPTSIRHESG